MRNERPVSGFGLGMQSKSEHKAELQLVFKSKRNPGTHSM